MVEIALENGFWIFLLAVAGIGVFVFLLKKLFTVLLHPVRKAKVQVAAIEYQDQNLNAKARKLASNPMGGNRSALQVSHLAHVMVDDMLFTFYQMGKDNKMIRLKIEANKGHNMARVGDVGFVTYQNGQILAFEKIGNINEK